MVEYETVWSGGTGWTHRPGARGALLPDYDTQTAQVFQERARPNVVTHPQDAGRTYKYTEATRLAVQAAYAKGRTLTAVSKAFGIPISTVYNLVSRAERNRNDGPV